MKVRILTVLLAAALALVPCVTAIAADEEASATVDFQPRWVGMNISPDSWDIENVEAESSYTESFTLANSGGVGGAPLDIYIQGSNATNGENNWVLSGNDQYTDSMYALKYAVSDNEFQAATSSEPRLVAEGLPGAYDQDISLELLTPTTPGDQSEPVSTSIDLYAVKNPQSQSLSGEQAESTPSGDFAQYPSEISITGATAGEPVVFEDFYIRNDTDEEKTFYLSTYAPRDDFCSDGYTRMTGAASVTMIVDNSIVDSVTVPANDSFKVQVRVAIPENQVLEGEQWECWIVATTTDPEQEEPEEGINFNTYVCSRLLITAAGGSDGSGGVGAATIIGAICGSALLVGFLGWRISRRNNGSVIDSSDADGDADSDVDSDDDTSEAVTDYAGSSYDSSDDTDFSALADDPDE